MILHKYYLTSMFTSNQQNYFPKTNLITQYNLSLNDHLNQIQHFSLPISSSFQTTALFSIIQHSLFTKNIQLIQKIIKNCEEEAKKLVEEDDNEQEQSCWEFVRMIRKLKKRVEEEYEESCGVLGQLYQERKVIEKYVRQGNKKDKENWAEETVQQLGAGIIVFQIAQNDNQRQLMILNQYHPNYNNLTNIQRTLCGVRLGFFKNQYCILYNLKDSYIDLLSQILYESHQNNKIINTFQKQHKQLKKQYQKLVKKNQEEMLRSALKIQDFELQRVRFDNDYDDLLFKYEEAAKGVDLKGMEIERLIVEIDQLREEVRKLRQLERGKRKKIHFYSEEKGRDGEQLQKQKDKEKQKEKDKQKQKPKEMFKKKKDRFKIVLEQQKQRQRKQKQPHEKQKETQLPKQKPAEPRARKNSLIDTQQDPLPPNPAPLPPPLPTASKFISPKRPSKFKIVQFVPTLHKSQSQPNLQPQPQPRSKLKSPFTMIFQKAQTGQMTKLNALTFSIHSHQSQCQTCQQIMIPYSIFDCNHLSCSNCLVRYIQLTLLDRQIPICINQQCRKQCNTQTTITFLTFKQRRDLCVKLEQTIFRIKNKNRIYDCRKCQQAFLIEQQAKFVTHCGVTFCRACGDQHPENQKCDQARYLNLLNQLIYPTVCPECYTLYDKDDKCDHVVCPNCKEKNPVGFCARCAVIRSPTMAHDISYHRVDCSFYAPNPEPLRREKKCLECNKLEQGHCDRPEETLNQFVMRVYGKKFTEKFYEKRKEYQNLKDLQQN